MEKMITMSMDDYEALKNQRVQVEVDYLHAMEDVVETRMRIRLSKEYEEKYELSIKSLKEEIQRLKDGKWWR